MYPDRALCGRDAERSMIRELLRRAERGADGVVLIEGEPGIGKSRLLRDACQEAGDRAFSLVAGAADPLAHATPLFTLRAALHEPLTGLAASHDGPDEPSAAYELARIRSRLEQRAASAPLLICLDDLHCEGERTLAALRCLRRDLCRQPLAWLLARSNTVRGGADHLFALLERDGAVRITLGPLAPEAAEIMLADAFGAPPDPRLAALALDAAGNPALLTELIGSLRENQAVEVSGGRSVLASQPPPPQFCQVARRRLGQVSRQTRHLLVAAAVLGPAFRLEDAAEMLGVSPASLLPAMEEALDAALVSTAEHGFSFRSELLRRAQPNVMPGSQDDPQLRRSAQHQELDLPAGFLGPQLVDVVENQPQAVLQRCQVREQPLDDRPVVQIRRRRQLPNQPGSGFCLAQGGQH
jgi:predicted ATPase